MRIFYPVILLSVFALESCNRQNINDASKRNEDWVWWVDAKTKKGEWIPVGDQGTVKNGEYTAFYSKGQIYAHGRIKDGKDVDTAFYYTQEGRINLYLIHEPDTVRSYFPINGNFKLNTPTGQCLSAGIVEDHHIGKIWTKYYKDGLIQEKKRIGMDNKGWEMHYYEYSGQIRDSAYFENDTMNGLRVDWFDNGQIKAVCNYKAGTPDGDITYYYESGKIKKKYTLANGKPEGKYISFFEDGGCKEIAFYKDNLADGEELDYYPNGKLRIRTTCKAGKKHGDKVVYYENGQVCVAGHYLNGHQDGHQRWYYKSGKLAVEFTTDNDDQKTYQVYDSTGTKMNFSSKKQMEQNGIAIIKELYKNIPD